MSGGTGDADLYVKRGSQPTSSSYDYRPYLNGNNETVNVTNPVAGDWYISIYAYSTFSSVSLKATYAGGSGGGCTSCSGTLSGTGANSYQPSSSGYVSIGERHAHGKLTGPAGTDFDLYLQKWNGSSWAQRRSGEPRLDLDREHQLQPVPPVRTAGASTRTPAAAPTRSAPRSRNAHHTQWFRGSSGNRGAFFVLHTTSTPTRTAPAIRVGSPLHP